MGIKESLRHIEAQIEARRLTGIPFKRTPEPAGERFAAIQQRLEEVAKEAADSRSPQTEHILRSIQQYKAERGMLSEDKDGFPVETAASKKLDEMLGLPEKKSKQRQVEGLEEWVPKSVVARDVTREVDGPLAGVKVKLPRKRKAKS